jgi:cytoskeletal protein RodZ
MTDSTLTAIGSILKEQRRQKGLSLETAAEATRVQLKFLAALEEDKWDDFPARVYLEGFLKKYADFLGLPSDDLLHQLRSRLGQNNKPAFGYPTPVPESFDARSVWPNRLPVILFLVALLVLGIFYLYRGQQEKPKSPNLNINTLNEVETVAPVASTMTTTVAPPPTPVGHTLTLRAQSPVWLRVWLDGEVRFEGTLAAGEPRQWPFDNTARLRVGNLSRLGLDIDGKPIPTAGAVPGEIQWPGREGTFVSVTPTPLRSAPRSTSSVSTSSAPHTPALPPDLNE